MNNCNNIFSTEKSINKNSFLSAQTVVLEASQGDVKSYANFSSTFHIRFSIKTLANSICRGRSFVLLQVPSFAIWFRTKEKKQLTLGCVWICFWVFPTLHCITLNISICSRDANETGAYEIIQKRISIAYKASCIFHSDKEIYSSGTSTLHYKHAF